MKFKVGERVLQHAEDGSDRTYYGTIESYSTDGHNYYVRWHHGFASWEREDTLEAAPL